MNAGAITPELPAELLATMDTRTLWKVLDEMPIRVAYFDRDRRYRFANKTYAAFIGRSRADIVGRTIAEIRGPEVAARLRPDTAAALAGETVRGEGWSRVPGCEARYIKWVYQPHRLPDGTVAGYFVMVRDITDLKRTEESLRESEERFRSIAESHPVPVVIVRIHDGIIVYASPACAHLWGHPVEAIVGSHIVSYYTDPAEREAAHNTYLRQGYLDAYEVTYKRADGTAFPAAITTRPITYQGDACAATGIFDLSEQKAAQAELARQREVLHQSEKLNALGSLLAGISHELNNPLSVVVGQALMLTEAATDPAIAERARRIGAAADRCARIVRTFLAMARQEPAQRGEVRLNDVVHATLDITGYMLRSADIAVVTELAPDLPPVWADKDQLAQVLMNLVVNAQQAMLEVQGPRRLEIATEADVARARVRLRVRDTGPGVPRDIRSRIFEPFFTTKPVGSGTGVGLAVSRGIVQAHGGRITLAGGLGPGAAFTVELPMATNKSGLRADSTRNCGNGRACRILVVDDEPEILDVLTDVLSGEGHEVLRAKSGDEALSLIVTAPVDAILTDLRMPGIDGPAFCRVLAERHPELAGRVAFITGDTLGPDLQAFLKDSARPYLEKPFTPGEVRSLVRGLLEQAVPAAAP